MIYIISFLLTTKWLRILSIPINDKIRNHLVANYNKNIILSLKYIILLFTAINITNTDANIIKPITLHDTANDLHNFISIGQPQ